MLTFNFEFIKKTKKEKKLFSPAHSLFLKSLFFPVCGGEKIPKASCADIMFRQSSCAAVTIIIFATYDNSNGIPEKKPFLFLIAGRHSYLEERF